MERSLLIRSHDKISLKGPYSPLEVSHVLNLM